MNEELVLKLTTKRCCSCGIRKSHNEFGKDRKNWDGKKLFCENCEKPKPKQMEMKLSYD